MFFFDIKNKNASTKLKEIDLSLKSIRKKRILISHLNKIKKKIIPDYYKKNSKKPIFINCVVSLTLSGRNAHVSLNNIKGNVIKKFTAGNLKFRKNKKRILVCLKTLILAAARNKYYFKQPIAVHLNNFYSKFFLDFILKLFKKNSIYIGHLKLLSRPPYNGCRPKKIRRKKKKKILFN